MGKQTRKREREREREKKREIENMDIPILMMMELTLIDVAPSEHTNLVKSEKEGKKGRKRESEIK